MVNDFVTFMLQDLPLTWDEVRQIRLDGAYITRLQMNKQANVNVRYTTTRPENQEEWPFRLKNAYDAVVLFGEAFESHRARTGSFPTKVAQCPTASDTFTLSSVMQDIKEVNKNRTLFICFKYNKYYYNYYYNYHYKYI